MVKSGHGVIALALVAIYIPRLLDGAERTAKGRPWPWLWHSPVWRFCSEFLGCVCMSGGARTLDFVVDDRLASQRYYCSVTITREQELDPAKQYIFGFYPHGILILSRIATYGGTWEAVFPGISARCECGASFRDRCDPESG